ncbi:MAG: class D beta-lactamase [Gemmatimonadota bacterium]
MSPGRWGGVGLVLALVAGAGCEDLLQAGRSAFGTAAPDSTPQGSTPRSPPPGQEQPAPGGVARQSPLLEARPDLLGRPAWEGERSGVADNLRAIFEDEGAEGVIVVHDLRSGATLRSDSVRAGRRAIPASTFKILNALIALETGVISGSADTIPWDGVDRGAPAWNRDHDLASAFRASAVWYYQELARRVGLERMEAWLRRIGYGNSDVGGVVDGFWLDGPLAVSPDEQIGFLRRLQSGQLPFSTRSMEVVREIMVLERGADWTLRGKTGWSRQGLTEGLWFVGWVERGDDAAFFAIEFEISSPNRDVGMMRERIYRRTLSELGLIPS